MAQIEISDDGLRALIFKRVEALRDLSFSRVAPTKKQIVAELTEMWRLADHLEGDGPTEEAPPIAGGTAGHG